MQEWISSPVGMHPVDSGQWVLAVDAIAERDLWRIRCEAIVAMLKKEVLVVSDEERGVFISIKTPRLHAAARAAMEGE